MLPIGGKGVKVDDDVLCSGRIERYRRGNV
jgi:hypothetical protein